MQEKGAHMDWLLCYQRRNNFFYGNFEFKHSNRKFEQFINIPSQYRLFWEKFTFHIVSNNNLTIYHMANNSTLWLADHASESHICNSWELFSDYVHTPDATISDAGTFLAAGKRTIKLWFHVGTEKYTISLTNVIHAPEMLHNLLALEQLTKHGFEYSTTQSGFCIFHGDQIIGEGTTFGTFIKLNVTL